MESLVLGFCKCKNCGFEKFYWNTYFKCAECGSNEYEKAKEDYLEQEISGKNSASDATDILSVDDLFGSG